MTKKTTITPTATIFPRWNPGNLSKHVETRKIEKASCFEGLLGISGRRLLGGDLRKRSEEVFSNALLEAEYDKESFSGAGHRGGYIECRVQHTDHELMTAITNSDRSEFITCFHTHFDPESCQGIPKTETELGQSLHKVVHRLREDVRRKKIRNLTFIKS
ncbi:MAG: hypothetical protein L3J39_07790 [Verrucomicrobiales bacterium]|nr:hypothetical protein [Verrucomicrobiales bacterium]